MFGGLFDGIVGDVVGAVAKSGANSLFGGGGGQQQGGSGGSRISLVPPPQLNRMLDAKGGRGEVFRAETVKQPPKFSERKGEMAEMVEDDPYERARRWYESLGDV